MNGVTFSIKWLSISLLGGLEVRKDGTLPVNFRYDKVRALLALLVVESRRVYRRDELAGLLWPDLPEEAARANLRQALGSLRGSLGDSDTNRPCLCVSRDSIQWNPAVEVDIDVQGFTRLLQACEHHAHGRAADCSECARRRAEALRLYRGDLLQGFFLPDADAFDNWLTVHRESLRLQALAGLHDLAEYHERREEYDLAEAVVRRELEMEPWDEDSHRRLMRLLSLNEKRSQALAQYDLCRKVLSVELGVEPEPATTALFEDIRSGARPVAASGACAALPLARSYHLPQALAPLLAGEPELVQVANVFDIAMATLMALMSPGGTGLAAPVSRQARAARPAAGHGNGSGRKVRRWDWRKRLDSARV